MSQRTNGKMISGEECSTKTTRALGAFAVGMCPSDHSTSRRSLALVIFLSWHTRNIICCYTWVVRCAQAHIVPLFLRRTQMHDWRDARTKWSRSCLFFRRVRLSHQVLAAPLITYLLHSVLGVRPRSKTIFNLVKSYIHPFSF